MPESGKDPLHSDIAAAARRALLQAGRIQEAKVKLRQISERTAKMVPPLNEPALANFIRQTLEANASCKVHPDVLRLCWTDLAEEKIRKFAADNGWKVKIQEVAEFTKDE